MSKTVDELVEKVARAIASAYHDVNGCAPGTLNRTEALDAVERFWPDYKPEARAAIAAVAEWLEVDVGTPSAYVTADNLREQVAPTLCALALEAKP